MPWTRQQVKYLLSSGSPLTPAEKQKMEGELHANPAMGHMKKGYKKTNLHGHHSADDGMFLMMRAKKFGCMGKCGGGKKK